jgi:hypothetical protein
MQYRKYLIVCINIVIAIWLIKTVFFPAYDTEFFGVFLIMVLGFCFIYNIYALLLYKYYFIYEQNNIILEAVFILLLLLPFFIFWFFTS